MFRNLKINTTQIAALRSALTDPQGVIHAGDRCTGKALVARGFATEGYHPLETNASAFFITDAGRERAKKAADFRADRNGIPISSDLMRDLATGN